MFKVDPSNYTYLRIRSSVGTVWQGEYDQKILSSLLNTTEFFQTGFSEFRSALGLELIRQLQIL